MLLLNFNAFSAQQAYLIILVSLLVVGCGSVQQVVIPPQQEFTIGGGDHGVYDVKVINQGAVAVRLSEKLEYGESIDQGFLSRGEKVRLSFLSGSSAVFSNVLSDTVYLKLRVFSTSELKNRQNPVQ